jgi:hypothetical protein
MPLFRLRFESRKPVMLCLRLLRNSSDHIPVGSSSLRFAVALIASQERFPVSVVDAVTWLASGTHVIFDPFCRGGSPRNTLQSKSAWNMQPELVFIFKPSGYWALGQFMNCLSHHFGLTMPKWTPDSALRLISAKRSRSTPSSRKVICYRAFLLRAGDIY